MSVRLREGALPWPGQEHGATGHAVCLEQSVDVEETPDGRRTGMTAAATRARALEWLEMNEIESNTSQEIVANLSALALGVLLSFNSRGGAGYADLP